MKIESEVKFLKFRRSDSSDEVIPLNCAAVSSPRMYRLGLRTLSLLPALTPSAAALAPVSAPIGEWMDGDCMVVTR